MIVKLYTASSTLHDALLVTVEVNILPGQANIHIIGLGDNTVKESKERIRSAIISSGFVFPVKNIIINLFPNDQPKIGSSVELAIALGILIISNQIPQSPLRNKLILGSLSLDGTIQKSDGMFMSTLLAVDNSDIDSIIVPKDLVNHISCIPNIKIYPLEYLGQITTFSNKEIKLVRSRSFCPKKQTSDTDMSFIHGQEHAKRALAFAAIGGHHTVLFGSPGTGKSMLADAFPGILPDISLPESLEVTKIYATAGKAFHSLMDERPVRGPHHTTSEVAIVGGGGYRIMPGEISLAHTGVLVLNELFEFRNTTLQALREPLEEKVVKISRVRGTVVFPAHFILLGTANPCKCGYLFSHKHICSCSPKVIKHFFQKITGPFEDRIALEVEMNELDDISFADTTNLYLSSWWKSKVEEANCRMLKRNNGQQNNYLDTHLVLKYFKLLKHGKQMANEYSNAFGLSYRGLIAILRVALSIQDFEEQSILREEHLHEAFQFKLLKKKRTEMQHAA